MDKYELKYKWEENKRSILSGVGLTAGLALVGGGIFMMTQNFLYDETAGPEVVLAEHLVVHNDKGELDLYDIEDEKAVDSLALPKEFLIGSNQNLDQTYVYDKDEAKLYRVDVEKEELSFESIYAFDDVLGEMLKKSTGFETTDEQFAFQSKEGFLIVNDEETKDIAVDGDVDAWSLSDAGLYFAQGDNVSFVDFEDEKEHTIEIGAKTSRIHPNGRSMMVHNTFGSNLGSTILLRLPQEGLNIEEMRNIDSIYYTVPKVPGDENQLVYMDIERNEEGTALRKQLIVRNAVTVEDEEENKELVLELTGEGNFLEDHTIASNGFLYNYEEGQFIGVSEIRNGRQYKTVPVTNMSTNNPYFLPVYND